MSKGPSRLSRCLAKEEGREERWERRSRIGRVALLLNRLVDGLDVLQKRMEVKERGKRGERLCCSIDW